jgi:hypothetical protein
MVQTVVGNYICLIVWSAYERVEWATYAKFVRNLKPGLAEPIIAPGDIRREHAFSVFREQRMWLAVYITQSSEEGELEESRRAFLVVDLVM